MTADKIDVEDTIKKVRQLLAEEAHLSVALRAALEVLLVLVHRSGVLANRLSLNSRNSNKPPSTDRFNKDGKDNSDDKQGKNNKPSGQPGRMGATLQKVDDPNCLNLIEPLCRQGSIRRTVLKAVKYLC